MSDDGLGLKEGVEVAKISEFSHEEKLGFILVEILLMQSKGRRIRQNTIQESINKKENAPKITNINPYMKKLRRSADLYRVMKVEKDGRVKTELQPWLNIDKHKISFYNPETILKDYRACASLLQAFDLRRYNDVTYTFELSLWFEQCSKRYGIAENLCRMFLDDYRVSGYTEKYSDTEEEIIELAVQQDLIFLKIAEKEKNLIKQY